MAPVVPYWKVTRTPYGRRLWEALDRIGIKAAVMVVYGRGLDRVPDERPVPDDVEMAVRRGDDLPDSLDRELPVEPGDSVVLARDDDGIVGRCLVSHDRPVGIDVLDERVTVDGAYCWRLLVDPAHRNRGIATAIVERSLQVAADRMGADSAYALIASDNYPSRWVFEANGFEARDTVSYYRAFGRERRRTDGLPTRRRCR